MAKNIAIYKATIDNEELNQIRSVLESKNDLSKVLEFEDNMKKGLLNQNGEPFLPPIFSDIIPCNDLSIIIKKDNRYGLLNPDGDLILMPEYKNIIYLTSSKKL